MYLLDRRGKVVWLNDAAEELVPGAVGKKFTYVLAPDEVHKARRIFALRILGQAPFSDHTTTVRLADGGRQEVDISSVPLRKHRQIVGVFGVIRGQHPVTEAPEPLASDIPTLTPRQAEVPAHARHRFDDASDGRPDGALPGDRAQPRQGGAR